MHNAKNDDADLAMYRTNLSVYHHKHRKPKPVDSIFVERKRLKLSKTKSIEVKIQSDFATISST